IEDPFSCSDTDILSFNFNEQKNPTIIDKVNHEISLNVRFGTSREGLIPSFTLSSGATATVEGTIQLSGFTANNFTSDVIYTVTAADEVTIQDWVISVGVAQNDSTDILRFAMDGQTGPAVIDSISHTVDLEVVYGTDLVNQAAEFVLSAGAMAEVDGAVQESGSTVVDFTDPVIYTIIAQDRIEQQEWVVTVTLAPNTASDFISFSLPQETGKAAIDSNGHTIDAEVVYGTDIGNLVAAFTLSHGATARVNGALQESGVTVNDFIDGLTYSVTAEDGTSTQEWNVKVDIAPNTATEFLSFSMLEQTSPITIDSALNLISVEVAIWAEVEELTAYFTLSDGATAYVDDVEQESGITVNDFSDTLVYTVIAQDGMSVTDWQVAVTRQDVIDNENPVLYSGILPEEYPVGQDSILTGIRVLDNIAVKQVIFRYKKYQEESWDEVILESEDSLFTYHIREPLVRDHGMFYYYKAIDFKDNADSTDLTSMVLRFDDQNSLAIPDLEFGPAIENYQIISTPITLDNNDVGFNFNELMPYNKKLWRLFHYNNGITSEYGTEFTTLSAGKGYWLIIRNEVPIQMGAGITTRIENETGFGITLQPGWNQIGNPYNFGISWDDVLEFNAAENINRVKLYINGELLESDSIAPFRGGFVFSGSDEPELLFIHPNPGSMNGRIAKRQNLADFNDLGSDRWFLPLIIRSGNYKNSLNGIGMHPESGTGFDKFDEPVLPVPSELSGVDMYFLHTGEKYEKLGRDIVTSSEFYSWEFRVSKHGEAGTVSLNWENEFFGNNDFSLFMLDEKKDRIIDMRSQESYSFTASETQKFRIYYGRIEKLSREVLPSRIHLGEIYPNPFTDELFIPLSLPGSNENYQLSFTLTDLKGNRVQELPRINLREGIHQIRVGMSDHFNDAAGFYIIRIVILSDDHKEILYRKILKF
ncbi:MAG: hypothetical protein KFF73_20775, partial [Cyclobacteriaceae bacterium]|nr:hypothetical protein [Cyclobacteriaceae bacterium]